MDLASRLDGWHRRAAAVCGAVALTLVRRGLTRGMLRQWGAELAAVGQEMMGAEKEMDEHAKIRVDGHSSGAEARDGEGVPAVRRRARGVGAKKSG